LSFQSCSVHCASLWHNNPPPSREFRFIVLKCGLGFMTVILVPFLHQILLTQVNYCLVNRQISCLVLHNSVQMFWKIPSDLQFIEKHIRH
jgi:hypothetical protein